MSMSALCLLEGPFSSRLVSTKMMHNKQGSSCLIADKYKNFFYKKHKNVLLSSVSIFLFLLEIFKLIDFTVKMFGFTSACVQFRIYFAI